MGASDETLVERPRLYLLARDGAMKLDGGEGEWRLTAKGLQ